MTINSRIQWEAGATDISNNIRRLHSHVNNRPILSAPKSCVLCTWWKLTVFLYYYHTNCMVVKTGRQTAVLCTKLMWPETTASGDFFSCCCQHSVKPLQFFTGTLCMPSLIDQSRLIFWKRMHMSHNTRFVLNRFVATGNVYGINNKNVHISATMNSIWVTFTGHALQSL